MRQIKKNFGFGCMRLPMQDGEVDYEQFSRMIDTFMDRGFNYFDTAHGYLEGKSEIALKKCLTSRYLRTEYQLVNKLTAAYFNKEEDIRPFFESQLEICGVDYFDFYLMHAQNEEYFAKFKRCHAYETAFALKEEGKIRHVGISFHDKAEVLDQILTEYPDIEVVQIQLNYVDYEDEIVQSRKCLEVCQKHGKMVIVMEPVKGGNLVNLPDDCQAVFDELGGGSNASYAIRFAAGCDNVIMVLSGMSNMEQLEDNLSYMEDFQPLDEREMEAVEKVCEIFRSKEMIPCTACRYCTEGCPKKIAIPDVFSCLNMKRIFQNANSGYYYKTVYTVNNGKASECVQCGKCEKVCPQHLPIRKLLQEVAAEFEQ